MHTVLLLTDCPLGSAFQIKEVTYEQMMDLLPKRQAMIATPLVRQRYAEQIKAASTATEHRTSRPTIDRFYP